MNFVTPSGFRDVLTDEAVLREQAAQAVQANMAAKGYLPVETPTLEVMDVLQAGGRLPGTPFKLFDARGDLLAMRPAADRAHVRHAPGGPARAVPLPLHAAGIPRGRGPDTRRAA